METRFKDLENNILYAESTILDPRFKARALRNQECRERTIEGLENKAVKHHCSRCNLIIKKILQT